MIGPGLFKSIDKEIDSIPHKFLDCYIQEYKDFNESAASSFMVHCKTAPAVDQVRNLLALKYSFLELCNALRAHAASRRALAAQTPDTPEDTPEVLDDAGRDDDADAEPNAAPAADAPRAAPAADHRHDFKTWPSKSSGTTWDTLQTI